MIFGSTRFGTKDGTALRVVHLPTGEQASAALKEPSVQEVARELVAQLVERLGRRR